jgi:quercetin dioxygenase-like cupin family protein
MTSGENLPLSIFAMLQSPAMQTRVLLPALCCATLLFMAPNAEVEITAEPHHHQALENQYVRVFKVEVAPHAETLMHWHHHDYFYVTLGDTQVENDVKGKAPANVKLQNGETRFSPGNFAHIAKNLADTPFRNVTIEYLQDEKARQSPPPKWDEDRALHVLNAGTQDILFVKDGVRVSDIQLQPGGVIPRHHHATPHLLVALSDLKLKSENANGKPPAIFQAKAGDIRWVEAGDTHTVTNIGKQSARYITFEFPVAQQ